MPSYGPPLAGGATISRQLLQQCFGLLQIGGVKALGEPAVDRCQQRRRLRRACPGAATAGSGSWRPVAPRTWPAGGGPRRGPAGSRFRPAGASGTVCRSNSSPCTRCRSAVRRPPVVSHHRQRLPSRCNPSSTCPTCPYASARACTSMPTTVPVAREASSPDASGRCPPLPGPVRPAPSPGRTPRTPRSVQIRARSPGSAGLGVRLGRLPLPAAGMESSTKAQYLNQGEGVRQRVRHGQRLLTPLHSLVRIAQRPQDPGHYSAEAHPMVRIDPGKVCGVACRWASERAIACS